MMWGAPAATHLTPDRSASDNGFVGVACGDPTLANEGPERRTVAPPQHPATRNCPKSRT